MTLRPGDTMRLILFRLVLAVAILCPSSLARAQEVPGSSPTWEELRARPYPQWFLDAKLGIFIHWGAYSVPAYSGKEDYAEWFVRGLQLGDTLRTRFMRESYGADFEYADFAPLFRAELFDPGGWAKLFHNAGARYVVMVSKHHDGYALWPSEFSPGWNSVEVGPHRDLVGDLTEAVRGEGLRMGLYYSLAEWNHPLHRWYTDPPDSIGRYVDDYMIPQFKELVSTYRPSVIFADGEWLNSAEQWRAREFIGWYFDTVGPEAIVNDRWGGGSDIGFKTPEYSAGLALTDRPWAEVRGLGRSFGLNRNEALDAYMTPGELVHSFVRAVAAGGGMILNVGPKADGQIPLLQQERLIQLGDWLQMNGEAIYGSRPWIRSGELGEVSLKRVDPRIDFNWVRNGPGRPIREDDFTATWTGTIRAEFSEPVTFEAEADEFIRVWVGDQLVVDQWDAEEAVLEEERAPNATIPMRAGEEVPFRVEYREKEVNAWARLFWSSPSRSREIIPDGSFRTEEGDGAQPGLLAEYRSLQETLAYTRKDDTLFAITFRWPDRELALPIPAPRAGVQVSLLGREGQLPWRYEHDTLFVDLSDVGFSEIPGDWAWTIRLEGYGSPPIV
jgi:alpha-L-fucosidase